MSKLTEDEMRLIDMFAAHALTGLVAAEPAGGTYFYSVKAMQAYGLAKEMFARREKERADNFGY